MTRALTLFAAACTLAGAACGGRTNTRGFATGDGGATDVKVGEGGSSDGGPRDGGLDVPLDRPIDLFVPDLRLPDLPPEIGPDLPRDLPRDLPVVDLPRDLPRDLPPDARPDSPPDLPVDLPQPDLPPDLPNDLPQPDLPPDLPNDLPVDLAPDAPDDLAPDVSDDLPPDLSSDTRPPPTCAISKPTKTKLNGVAVPAGDRSSAPGADYATTFEITTDADDGQIMRVEVAAVATPTIISSFGASAMGGRAVLPAVIMKPDGDFLVEGICINQGGVETRTGKVTITVDSSAPQLTVTDPTSGKHYNPGDLTAGTFKVCATTTSSDAVNVPPSGMMSGNLCAAIGTASPLCAGVSGTMPPPMTAGAGCVDLACPGGAPFNLTVNLFDAVGNPTQVTVTGVTCSLTLPSVQIVAPLGDMPPFTDMAKRLLAATASQALHDLDVSTPGAQTNVVACTDRMDGRARLFAGPMGGTLMMTGGEVTAVPAQMSDNCPAGLGFAARFVGVTLPESTMDAGGALTTPTQIRVDVTDVSLGTGTSPAVNLWVDSMLPAVAITAPSPFCGTAMAGTPNATVSVSATPGVAQASLSVTNGSTTTTYTMPTIGSGAATFANVLLAPGQNQIAISAPDPAGNVGALPPPCTVTVNSGQPVVTWVVPTVPSLPAMGNTILCANQTTGGACVPDGDTDAANGWQGSLAVRVTLDGTPVNMTGTVTFAAGITTLGTANIAADGTATLAVTTPGVPDGTAVAITATTSDIMGRGTGSAPRTFLVDVSTPSPMPVVQVAIQDRRAPVFRLSWPVPTDMGTGLATYDIRYGKVSNCSAFVFGSGTPIPFPGTPTPSGTQTFDVSTLLMETGYCFGVQARDGAGNLSTVGIAAMAITAQFNLTTLAPPMGGPANEQFGTFADGAGDVNGDSLSDVLVGTGVGNKAYLFLGAASFAPAAPSTVISGTSASFGGAVAQIGNFDNDGPQDIAVGAWGTNKVLIYKGRSVWPAALSEAEADWEITTDASYAASAFGLAIARLGDFTGDGIDDFAIAASRFNSDQGRVVIISGQTDTRVPGASKITIALPEVTPTRSIVLNGDPALVQPRFGSALLGLGRHYTEGSGTTLIVSATGRVSNTTSNEGRVYGYRMDSLGAVGLGPGTNPLVGPAKGARVGFNLANIGVLSGTSPNVGIGNPLDSLTVSGKMGTVFVTSGTSATGPLANRSVIAGGFSGTGQAVFGGGLLIGSTLTTVSIFGNASPDIGIMSGSSGNLYMISGQTFLNWVTANPTTPFDLATMADFTVPVPAGWGATVSSSGGLIRDINGDGLADFSLADTGSPPGVGKVVVYW